MSGSTDIDMATPLATSVAVPPPLRWWGWGDRDGEISDSLLAELQSELGISGAVCARPVALEDVELGPSRFPASVHDEFRAALGGHVYVDRRQRVAHAGGKSYVDIMEARCGRAPAAPDAVLYPGSEAEVATVLALCERHSVAVVPFGGGTSVVGGVAGLRGAHGSVVALDLSRMNNVVEIDPINEIARLQPGMRGPAVEAALNARGFTLGHFPQSFEYATIGGFAATRSAGQASSGYGRFDEMVVGLRCVTPRGTLVVEVRPPNAAGPSLLQLALGSEGTLGVITEVSVRVRRRPTVQWYEAWSLRGFDGGVALLHRLSQAGILPDVARLSDAEESHLTMAVAGGAAGLMRRALALRGHSAPCLLIVGWDGGPAGMTRRRAAALHLLRQHGAVRIGRRVGDNWRRHRFDAPYLRDPLIDRGVLVETLETATLWDRIHSLRQEVVASLRNDLTSDGYAPLIGAHVSHSYPEGASLYVTVMARQPADAVAAWRAAKSHVCDILVQNGATISHHHAVGVDHAPWLEAEIGATGMATLRALKEQFDPAGILNPGKLITPA